jgi:hypothetical protein
MMDKLLGFIVTKNPGEAYILTHLYLLPKLRPKVIDEIDPRCPTCSPWPPSTPAGAVAAGISTGKS